MTAGSADVAELVNDISGFPFVWVGWSGRPPGEGEENLVEVWLAHGDVLDGDAGILDRAQGLHQAVAAGVDADGDPPGALVGGDRAIVQAGEHVGRAGEVGGV